MRMLVPPLLCLALGTVAQVPINGPMPGHVSLSEATIWLQCQGPCSAWLEYWDTARPDSVLRSPVQGSEALRAHAMDFVLADLLPGTRYGYRVVLNGQAVDLGGPLRFRTQPLWKHRTDPPAFTVALGSCAYINEAANDRPGEPYGGDYGIFGAIADKAPDVMLWLGDNVYLRETDLGGRSGYLHRYTHARSTPDLQRLLRGTHHYAIWDDHDFGPNDADGSWVRSATAREVFGIFWPNPTLGVPGAEGTTATMFTHADVDFFLLDNRTHRVPGNLATDRPAMLGQGQVDWLIRALKYSGAPFKLVAVGSQVLNSEAVHETYATMAVERAELLRRIEQEGITGVVFLTGDRHFTELSRVGLADGRTLHDLTVSPLTSGPYEPREKNTNRVEGTLVTERNFATLTFSGARKKRTMLVQVFDAGGTLLWERAVPQEKAH